jgi:hypothetical protein
VEGGQEGWRELSAVILATMFKTFFFVTIFSQNKLERFSMASFTASSFVRK